MSSPPSLLSLSIDATVFNLHIISDLSFLPEHILIDLFLVQIRQGHFSDYTSYRIPWTFKLGLLQARARFLLRTRYRPYHFREKPSP
ncbi:hypothetical protein Hanom_Chr03g00257041 [Helianthus anomalus]